MLRANRKQVSQMALIDLFADGESESDDDYGFGFGDDSSDDE